VGLAVAAACFADTFTLKSGRVVTGTYLGGTARQIRVDTGDQVQTLDVSDIVRIEFTSTAAAADSRPADGSRPAPRRNATILRPDPAGDDRPTLRRDASVATPDPADNDRPILRRRDGSVAPPDAPAAAPESTPAPAPVGSIELPAGTNLVVRMIEGVNSDVNRVGQTFAASLDEPVMLNGSPAIPRGADVVVKLVDAKESGTFTGRSELTLSLVSVKVNGRMVDLNTQTVSRESEARGNDTAKRAAGVGVVGAVIGAVAGGGKGAAIGAAAGGAAGAGSEIATKGPKVKIPSETRLTFVLDAAVKI
jgi:hypothetical protein